MEFREVRGGFVVRLERGERIPEVLLEFVREKALEAAFLSGIGTLEKVELGYYDLEQKTYLRRHFPEIYELTSLTGNLTYLDGEPFWHLHAVLADREFRAYSGHLFQATVAATGEFLLLVQENRIQRQMDPVTGLKLWKLSAERPPTAGSH